MLQFIRDSLEIKRLERRLGRKLTINELCGDVEDTHGFVTVLPVVRNDGFTDYEEVDLLKFPYELLDDPNVMPLDQSNLSIYLDDNIYDHLDQIEDAS